MTIFWCVDFVHGTQFGHLAALTSSTSSSRHFYPSLYLYLTDAFSKAVPTQDVTNPVSLPPFNSVLTGTRNVLCGSTS
jgi:hypothetical protein